MPEQAREPRRRPDAPRPALTPAQRDVAAGVVALVYAVPRLFAPPRSALYDELSSACALALAHAASDYDPAGGGSFATYARVRLRYECMDVLCRRARDRKRWPSLCDRAARRPRPPSPDEVASAAEEVRRLRLLLHEADWQVLWLHLAEGRSQEEIARRLNVSANAVSLRLAHARGRLLRRLALYTTERRDRS